MNSDIAAEEVYDPFKNGVFVPVKLIETEDDVKEIASNPNLMTDDDMLDLLVGKNWRAFDAKLAEIENAMTLERFLVVANRADAKVKQVNKIQDRLSAVNPSSDFHVEIEQIGTLNGPSDIHPHS